MRHVTVQVISRALDAGTAYDRVSDFRRYPELTEAVREVTVHPTGGPDGEVVSEWAVRFRNGTLRWTERDTFDRAALRLRFSQIDGDFAAFDGEWLISTVPGGTMVTFDASFDLGIPSLAEIIDPVAESTLRANVHTILGGLLGEIESVVSGGSPAAAPLTSGAPIAAGAGHG